MSYMSYIGNGYANSPTINQSGLGGINYQAQPQFAPQGGNYGLKMGIQFASQAEMEALIVPPNTQVMALGKEGDVFYVKSVDNLGRSNLKIYDFRERIIGEKVINTNQEFVTRNEFGELNNKISILESKIEQLNKPSDVVVTNEWH